MKNIILFLLFCILATNGFAKKKLKFKYPEITISPELKRNANAVIRSYNHTFELKDYGKAIEEIKVAITILNKGGEDFSQLFLPYDNSQKIVSVTGAIYNELGLVQAKIEKEDVHDYNYTSGGHIYDDIRVKIVSPTQNKYPYTVEYEYKKEYEGLIGYPTYYPIDSYKISVEKSEFSIIFPEDSKIRFRERNIKGTCREESVVDNRNIYKWKFNSLPALEYEPFSPRLPEFVPNVFLAPLYFNYEGVSGTMEDWNTYGKWVYELIKDRDKLPESRVNEIKSLVSGIEDTTVIIKTLYEYMQSHTRYVGIQMGLGGLQPFPAEAVSELGYGDCKALSNYMKAILKVCNIKSYYTAIGSGDRNPGITMNDFPAKNFSNHIILCVPVAKDTIWLECTSQDMPYGFLGSSNNNKTVLLITENGGKLAKTPSINQTQNFQFRNVEVRIDSIGTAYANVRTSYGGEQYENISSLLDDKAEVQKKRLYKSLELNGVKISNFSFLNEVKPIPEATGIIKFSASGYGIRSANRLFIPLNILNKQEYIPPKLENRKTEIVKQMEFIDIDTIVYTLPNGFIHESLPHNKSYISDFGEYNTDIKLIENQVYYVRELKMNKGNFPSDSYPALIKFYKDIARADRVKLVLIEQ